MSLKNLLGVNRHNVSIDVIDFSTQHVATGQVGAYIKKLYKEEGFRHIGYRYEKINGFSRFVIYTIPENRNVIQYFKDRCPAMVENECRALEGVGHSWTSWENGFEEIVYIEKPEWPIESNK